MRKTAVASLLCALLPLSVSATEVETRIINGSDTTATEFPSIASLLFETDTQYSIYCGATILDQYHVLTAAHCIYGDTFYTDNTYVVPQLSNKSDVFSVTTQKSQAVRIYYPDGYRDSSRLAWPDDIAIIEVEEPLFVSSSDYVTLATTAEQSQYTNTSLDHVAVGHGYIDNLKNDVDQLQKTTLNVVSDCTSAGVPSENRICTTGDPGPQFNNSTCQGDSGGPLYWDNNGTQVQIGITSFGPTVCGDPTEIFTSVFTDVASYQSWIDSVLAGQESPKIIVGQSFPFGFGDSGGGSIGFGALLSGLLIWRLRRQH